MAWILFVVHNEPGHLNPTLWLAKALRARGHRVSYASLVPSSGEPGIEEQIRRQGFEVAPFYSLFLGAEAARVTSVLVLGTAREAAEAADRIRCLEAVSPGSVPRDRLPDLCLVDALYPDCAIAAHRLRIPVMMVSTSLPAERRRGIPPLDSRLIPGRSPLSALRAALEWGVLFGRRRLHDVLMLPLLERPSWWTRWYWNRAVHRILMRLVGRRSWWALGGPALRRAAEGAGAAPVEVRFDSLFSPALTLPTLVLCPWAFDFPGVPEPGHLYLGPHVDLDRGEVPFPWERLDERKRLVYCSFGTQTHRYRDFLPALLPRLIRAFARLPDHQLVLAAGPRAPALGPGSVPANVVVVERAPQLALLRRASVMITHGGLGSVKEAICSGVPMLVIPMTGDQLGNGARVAYHGLGVVVQRGAAGPEVLGRQIERLTADREIRQRVEAMRGAFAEADRADAAVEQVESRLAR